MNKRYEKKKKKRSIENSFHIYGPKPADEENGQMPKHKGKCAE